MPEARILASGGIEKLGLPDSFIKFKTADGKKVQIDRPLPEHTVAVEFILEILTKSEYAVLDSVDRSRLWVTVSYMVVRQSIRASSSMTR